MSYTVKGVEVWAADVVNRPGMLARLLEATTLAGAQLDFLVARKVSDNTSRVFLSPLKGKKQKQAAVDMGMVVASGMHAVRIEGPDRPGLASGISRAVAASGINIRGVAGAVIGKKMVLNMAFDSVEDAAAAMKALRKSLRSSNRK